MKSPNRPAAEAGTPTAGEGPGAGSSGVRPTSSFTHTACAVGLFGDF